MARDPYEPRQCRARHGQKTYLQCQDEASEMTMHVCDHWATDRDGTVLRWTDAVAVYPAVDGNGTARDSQVGGEHYRQFKIQPWDIVDEYDLSFYAGNALKYLLRAGNKGPRVEDLRKCRHYLDKMIEIEEGGE